MSLRRIRDRDERGSAVVEAVIAVPAFMLFVLLVIAGGRVAIAQQSVQTAAADAARTASISRTPVEAKTDAQSSAAATLTDQHLRCTTTRVAVDTGGFAAPVGTAATVTATVACTVLLSDLTVPGLSGTRTVTATMSSPIDTYRERADR